MKVTIEGKPFWVNYHHLYCFFNVATEGGLVNASRLLGIGQSALSIQIRQLEKAFGFDLFNRSARQMVPNEQGLIVLAYCKEIFRLGTEMVEATLDRPTKARIHLQIGALDTIPKHISAELVTSALEFKPCTITVIEGKPSDLLRQLHEHKVDLLLMNFLPQTEPSRIYSRRIARLPLWIVGAEKFQSLKKGFPDSLNRQPFVIPTHDSAVRQEFDSYCKRVGISPETLVETQDVTVQKILAEKGVGLTLVPEFAVQEHLKAKVLYKIGEMKGASEDLFLIAASRKIENPLASHLMKKYDLVESHKTSGL